MNKDDINAGVFAIFGIGLLLIGNEMSDKSGGFLQIIGVGVALFGNLLILYSIYRGIRWIWKWFQKKKKHDS